MRHPCRNLLIATALALPLGAASAAAHTVTVDADPGEWFAPPASVANVGRLARRPGEAGEYVWRDAVGDGRSAWPAPAQELAEVRVTGDRTHLYIVARLGGPLAPGAAAVPQLRVALDTDRFHGSGGVSFGDSSLCKVDARGAYEALLVTRFGSGRAPRLGDAWGGEAPNGAIAALSGEGVIEIAVPWSSLGFSFVPNSPLRLAVALFLTGADDLPLDPSDGVAGRAADIVAPCGSPGAGTAEVLAEGSLDYAFDLWFDARGECIAPILVHEVHTGSGPDSQWVELVNATLGVVPLGEIKLGDAEQPQSPEGMGVLPAGTLLVPGQTFVVARDGGAFLARYGRHADAECIPADDGARDLFACPTWGSGPGFALDEEGDELVVLDGANTILDVVTLGKGSYPGVVAAGGVEAPHSLQRANPALDTDDCGGDFTVQVASPGVGTRLTASAGDDGPARTSWAPAWPNPSRGPVSLALRLAAEADVRIEVLDAGGRRVRGLHAGSAPAGELRLRWNATDDGGRPVPPGQYFIRAVAHGESSTLRVSVLR